MSALFRSFWSNTPELLGGIVSVSHEERRGDVLLAITTKKPSAKMPATPILSLSFICSREIMTMGRRMMMMSVVMLTENAYISVRTGSCAMGQRTGYSDPVVDFGRPWIALICAESENVL
jgi:hypothetical protein